MRESIKNKTDEIGQRGVGSFALYNIVYVKTLRIYDNNFEMSFNTIEIHPLQKGVGGLCMETHGASQKRLYDVFFVFYNGLKISQRLDIEFIF